MRQETEKMKKTTKVKRPTQQPCIRHYAGYCKETVTGQYGTKGEQIKAWHQGEAHNHKKWSPTLKRDALCPCISHNPALLSTAELASLTCIRILTPSFFKHPTSKLLLKAVEATC